MSNPPTKRRSAAYSQKHVSRQELQKIQHAAQLLKYTVSSGGCWVWDGSFFKDGYGQLKRYGKNLKAHRVFYEHYKGQIPEGLCILHACDNPACVNPDHLRPGTTLENVQDRDAKNRVHQTYLPHLGQKVNIRKTAREAGIKESSLRGRLSRGWPLSVAISQPPDRCALRTNHIPASMR